jgi:hypothetical protein
MSEYAFTEYRADDINVFEEGAFPPSEEEFMNALSLWIVCVKGDVTVKMASAAWRVPESLIAETIETSDYWMSLGGVGPDGTPIIHLEGV